MTRDEKAELRRLLRIKKLEKVLKVLPVLTEMADDYDNPRDLYNREAYAWLQNVKNYCDSSIRFMRSHITK